MLIPAFATRTSRPPRSSSAGRDRVEPGPSAPQPQLAAVDQALGEETSDGFVEVAVAGLAEVVRIGWLLELLRVEAGEEVARPVRAQVEPAVDDDRELEAR